jgi:hypothetical protein
MELLGDVGRVESCFETVLALLQERCSVCIKSTIGSKVVLDAPVVLLGDEGLVELCLVCLEIVLILT